MAQAMPNTSELVDFAGMAQRSQILQDSIEDTERIPSILSNFLLILLRISGRLIEAMADRPMEGVRSPATIVRETSAGMPSWCDRVDEFVRTPMSSVHSGQTGTPRSAVTPRVLDLSSGQR